jgi:hypothetical protein
MDEQPSLELTQGDRPPAPARATPRRPPPAAAPAPASETPGALDPVLEHLAREVTRLVSAATEQIRQASERAATNAVSRIAGHLDSRASAMDARLAETAQRANDLLQRMDDLLKASVEVAENNDSLLTEIRQEMVRRLENVIKRAEEQLSEILKRGEGQAKDLTASADRLVAEAKLHGRRAGWRPWAMAMGCALATILATTLLRPGWTMSGEQRRALRVGEAVIYTYSAASETERTEMRRVMRWRTPEQPDSLEAPSIRQ